jgi:hypothetical protein
LSADPCAERSLLRVALCALIVGAFCYAGDDGQTPATMAMGIGIDAHDLQAPLAGTHSSHPGGRFSDQVGVEARLVMRQPWAVRG